MISFVIPFFGICSALHEIILQCLFLGEINTKMSFV